MSSGAGFDGCGSAGVALFEGEADDLVGMCTELGQKNTSKKKSHYVR